MPYSTKDANQPPYYDDVEFADEDGRFLRILFKPGRAVQARELTQLQSLLQKQVGYMGNHFFKNYTVISGGSIGLDRTIYYRVKPSNDTTFDPTKFIGARIVKCDESGTEDSTDPVHGKVSHVEDATIHDPYYVFFITYESGIIFDASDYFMWKSSPEGLAISGTLQIVGQNDLNEHVTGVPENAGPDWYSITGGGGICTITDGLFYVDGHFVRCPLQGLGIYKPIEHATAASYGELVTLRNYNHLTSSIGLSITHEVVDYTDPEVGSSLLDPSTGTSNFAAPGADRYRMSLTLDQRVYEPVSGLTGISEEVNALDNISHKNFFEILRVKEGKTQSILFRTGYASLDDMLARRTYDESGNYIIRGFDMEMREHLRDSGGTQGSPDGAYTVSQGGNKNLIAVEFSPGKAYVKGRELESVYDTTLTIEKPRSETLEVWNDRVITNLGAYVKVDVTDGTGDDDQNGGFTLGHGSGVDALGFNNHELVSLVGDNNPNFHGSGGAQRVIGTARLRNLQYSEGQYMVFLGDIKMGKKENNYPPWPHYLIESIWPRTDGDVTNGTVNPEHPTGGSKKKMCSIHPTDGRFLGMGLTSGATGTYIFGKSKTSMVFVPEDAEYIKSFENMIYNTRKCFVSKADSDGDDSIQIPTGGLELTFPSTETTAIHSDYLIYSIDRQRFLNNTDDSITYSLNTSLNTVTIGGLETEEDYVLFVRLEYASGGAGVDKRTKTLIQGFTASVDLVENSDGKYEASLGYADVIKINSIKNDSGDDVSDRFIVDTGQRATVYDHASIVGTSAVTEEGEYTVDFDYFEASGVGPFLCSSYNVAYEDIPDFMAMGNRKTVHLRDAIDFRPVRKPNSDEFDQDIIPHHTTSSMGAISCSYKEYLGRIDKLYLDSTGRFVQIKGEPAKNRAVPENPSDGGMVLGTMLIPPYVVNLNNIKYVKSDNSRYTMRDIGNIKRRIGRLEYETQLSMLERNAESQLILDSEGNNRLKSGFLVDPMSGMNIVDTADADTHIKIMNGFAESPTITHNIDMVPSPASNSSSNLKKTSDDIWLLEWDPTNLVSQTTRTNRMSVNPFDIVSYVGEARIFPQSDTWVDTQTAPVFQSILDIDATMDGFDEIVGNMGNVIHGTNIDAAGFIGTAFDIRNAGIFQIPGIQPWLGAQFSSTHSSGLWGEGGLQTFLDEANLGDDALEIITTSGSNWWDENAWVLTQGFAETNQTTNSSVNLGSRVTNTSIIPFMRANQIKIHFVGLTPNTRHWPFFGSGSGSPVSEYCTPATPWPAGDSVEEQTPDNITPDPPGATAGLELRSDENGKLAVIFDLPGGIFRTGQRIFKITNDESNTFQHQGGQPSFAEVEYQARGTLQIMEEVVLNTSVRTNGLTRTEGQWVDLGTVDHARWGDPLAQTFMVSSDEHPDGIWLDSVDLFLAQRDDVLPINVQIKPVVNGYPSSGAAIPFASTSLDPLHPELVNVPTSADNVWDPAVENNATNFKFSTPVYLEPAEYCIVVTSNSAAYECYYCDMGDYKLELDGSVGEERVTEQPYAGSFFKSQNSSTWTAEQNQDMCFRLNRCNFTKSSGHLDIQETVHKGSAAQAEFTSAVTSTNLNNHYVIYYHRFTPCVIQLTPTGTNLSHETYIKNEAQATPADLPNNDISVNPAHSSNNNPNPVPNSRKCISVGLPEAWSDTDIANWGVLQDQFSIKHRINFTGDGYGKSSPCVDGQNFSMKLEERLGNHQTEIDPDETEYNGELESMATDDEYTPIVRYITKPIVLSDGLGANNLHVTLTQYMPEGTEIQVFVRHLPENSEQNIRNQRWDQMYLSDLSDVTGEPKDPNDNDNLTYNQGPMDIRDIKYQMQNDASEQIGEYQIKFVLHANATKLRHPVVINMRSIAVI